MALLLTALAVLIILVLNEVLWQKKDVHGEFSRKFVHVSVGSFVACWPFYLSWRQIEILGLAFLVGVTISKYLKIFQAIHSVQRPTLGEAFFAISIIALAFMTHNKWIYAAAALQMGLADGLAAIVGLRYGRRQSYVILDHTKSVIGTLTFFIVAVLILLAFSHYSGITLSDKRILTTAAIASVLENVAVVGIDNLLVPLAVALLLIHR